MVVPCQGGSTTPGEARRPRPEGWRQPRAWLRQRPRTMTHIALRPFPYQITRLVANDGQGYFALAPLVSQRRDVTKRKASGPCANPQGAILSPPRSRGGKR